MTKVTPQMLERRPARLASRRIGLEKAGVTPRIEIICGRAPGTVGPPWLAHQHQQDPHKTRSPERLIVRSNVGTFLTPEGAEVQDTGLRVASFFAGIGGFDLGFERAGVRTVWQCEIKKFCGEILEQHWPNLIRATDITKVNPYDIPEADIWAGGFPCQDVSLARMGPRSGLRGKQSGLFYDFAKLIAARKPPIVLLENVSGLLSSHNGRDFAVVVRTLADLGYGVAWRVLDSRYFGVPQSRTRVFVCAVAGDVESAGKILFEPERGGGNDASGGQDGTEALPTFATVAGDSRRGFVKGLAHCLYAESARHTGTDWSRNYVSYPDGRVRRLTPLECERLQGFPDRWTLPRHWADDLDRQESLRYHAVGNAVTVNVAEWLASRIVDVIGSRATKADELDLASPEDIEEATESYQLALG